MKKDFFKFSRYLFILTHPDDEIFICSFINKLIQKGKKVNILYVTSGDYHGCELCLIREKETTKCANSLGLSTRNLHFLRISESDLLLRTCENRNTIMNEITKIVPDCIITHEYEGGHTGHDIVSFTSWSIAKELKTYIYCFPAYYGWPENRTWNKFIPPKRSTEIVLLSKKMKQCKNNLINTYESQRKLFDAIKKSKSHHFFSREVLRPLRFTTNYLVPPITPVGYEYPGSSFRFDNFIKSIMKIIK